MQFGMGMGDIDMSNADNSDGYKSLNFTIHYDLFTANKNASHDSFDNSYYADVDFVKIVVSAFKSVISHRSACLSKFHWITPHSILTR